MSLISHVPRQKFEQLQNKWQVSNAALRNLQQIIGVYYLARTCYHKNPFHFHIEFISNPHIPARFFQQRMKGKTIESPAVLIECDRRTYLILNFV